MPAYPGISSDAFRHPLDREAEDALRSVPVFDLVARKFVEFLYERPQSIYLMGNSIQVGPKQYGTIYQIFQDCMRDLDIDPEPALFVAQNPMVNAYALGQDRPAIVLNTALVDLLSNDEIRAVLAHELGHIKCGHTVLIQMAIWVMGAAYFLGELTLGMGRLINSGLIYAFYEWRRKAELSSDRAALLVTDDLRLVMNSMMKLAGGSQRLMAECSLEEFIQQSENYQALDEDGLNQVYKFLLYNGGQGSMLTHPFAVERLYHLQQWEQSETYRQIRSGNYARSSQSQKSYPSGKTGASADQAKAEELRRQLQELQAEVARLRQQQGEDS